MGYTNKQKIRGWRRRKRHIDSWFNKYKTPNLNAFQARGEDYVKIRIDPWNLLCEITPPTWYFKLIIQRLIGIHDYWKKEYDTLGKPYDLQIWLNDPNTIRSQVVCAEVEQDGLRRNNYYRASSNDLLFPIAKWGSNKYDLDRFEWTLFDDEDLRFKNIEDLDDEEISELLKAGFTAEETVIDDKAETIFARSVGKVWVGREK